ncbi:uncharacterized protein LOC128391885 [Panonychus citri]|uniref:uncharacterized protein LOC128391885 n=1 Tax=Panonychus citri TaxID=50023 RepID=UPI002307A994|nr:uncharacterized protein LOC128391885 [Panonychus citri]
MFPRLGSCGSYSVKQLTSCKDVVFFTHPIRGLRYWYKNPGLPFPPNYFKSHQIFYPSLEVILKQKELNEKGIYLVKLGYDLPTIEGPSRRERRQATAKVNSTIPLDKLNEDELLEILETQKIGLPFSHDTLNYHYSRSAQGINSTVDLAHHYAIYEHLFSNHLERKPDKTVPHKKTDHWPQMEREWTEEELVKHSPGSRKIDPPALLEQKYFLPIVPMNIEFTVDADAKSDELTVSPVYKGNHIKPFFTKEKPDIIIDASLLSGKVKPFEEYQKITPNGIKLIGDEKNFYTLALLNLDSQFGKSDPVCHWLVSNIKGKPDGTTSHKEIISFIPPYAFKGFGYHRYVFLLLQSKEEISLPEITDVNLSKRILSINGLVDKGFIPVGLSWFQSSWDESCRDIFYNILNMREPTFEYIQPKEQLAKQSYFPVSSAFNIYLDAYRDPKEMAQEALLERLKEIDPFDYKNIIQPSKLPPNIQERVPGNSDRFAIPSWMWTTVWKKRNKLGRWRHLRNVSAIKPLNNNEDLDYPIWPFATALRYPSRYPWMKGPKTPHRDSKWALPITEHSSLRIQDEDIKGLRRQEIAEDLQNLKDIENKN